MPHSRRLPLLAFLALLGSASLLAGCGLFLPDKVDQEPERPAAVQ